VSCIELILAIGCDGWIIMLRDIPIIFSAGMIRDISVASSYDEIEFLPSGWDVAVG
jgi:hypothetical protein